jgi:O-succinylbenzoate synthase
MEAGGRSLSGDLSAPVRILGLELIEVQLSLKRPFVTHLGRRHQRSCLLLRVEGDEGLDGWGECVAGEEPSYEYETTETAWYVLTQFLLPTIPGREVVDPADLWKETPPVRGHPMAKAIVEAAVWDLQAREIGVPLWELLGGTGEPVPVGVSLGLQDHESLLREVETSVARGYARVKLKICPGRDLERVRLVREHFPDLPLSVDANGAYSIQDASRLKELDELGLSMLEQPLAPDCLVEHARLQSMLDTPICLDESIRSEGQALTALELDACRIVSVKEGPVGGKSCARSIEELCRARGVPAWVGGMLESGIGRAHSLALATRPGFDQPADLSESRRYWETDLVDPEFTLQEGRLAPSDRPGIGVVPNRDRIRAATVRRVVFGRLSDPVG